MIWLALVGIGSGMFNSPNTAAMMGTVPTERRGIAAGARTMLQNTGAVIWKSNLPSASERKTLDLDFTARIELEFATDSPELRAALERHLDYVAAETLATRAVCTPLAAASAEPVDIDGHPLAITIRQVEA